MKVLQFVKNFIFYLTLCPVFYLGLFVYWIVIWFRRKSYLRKNKGGKPRIIFGDHPLLSNQYWSEAMKRDGYQSQTLMKWHMGYQSRQSYDKFIDEIKVFGIGRIDRTLVNWFAPYLAFTFAIQRADVFHHHFYGGFLAETALRRWEPKLLHWMGCKVVITGVGGDFYRLSMLENHSIRNGFLVNYPHFAQLESKIERNVRFWIKHADCLINGFQIDHLGRWDALPYNMVTIDTINLTARTEYSHHDGKTGPVRVIHAPNHRAIKGSEFLAHAVETLNAEGLQVELLLMEGMPNTEVLRLMREDADILVDQLYGPYALTGMEGMVAGIPVMGNLDDGEGNHLHIFRRFSYLNECPILSASPETVTDQLRILVTRPDIRKHLGKACRHYVEKYHSEHTAQFLWNHVYERIWYGKEVDLMHLFHPLLGTYRKGEPRVDHPLIKNRFPEGWLEENPRKPME